MTESVPKKRLVDIRTAKRGDTTAILDIYAPFVLENWASFEETLPDLEEMWERIQTTLADYPWLVATDDGHVCGYAYAGNHRWRAAYRWACEVSVYIADTHYGRGIGRQLYETLFRLLTEQGYCTALAGIVIPNDASTRFHSRLGFEQIATYKRIGFKFGNWYDTTWWQIVLNDTTAPAEPVRFEDIDPKSVQLLIEGK